MAERPESPKGDPTLPWMYIPDYYYTLSLWRKFQEQLFEKTEKRYGPARDRKPLEENLGNLLQAIRDYLEQEIPLLE